MSNLSDIKRRLITVKQTRQITGAMQTVSVAKMRKAVEVCENSKAYLSLITDIVRGLPSIGRDELFAPTDGLCALVVLSSERGLCGGFDNDIFAAAEKEINDNTLIFPIGQSAANYFKSRSRVDLTFAQYSGADFSHINDIAEYLFKMYGNGVKCISVAYSEIIKQQERSVVERILPIEESGYESGIHSDMLFEPSPEQVLAALMPLYLTGKLYGAAVRNYAAEQSARHQAMSSATESADALIQQLSSQYNRERQATVTGQIVEIVGATSALSQRSGQ